MWRTGSSGDGNFACLTWRKITRPQLRLASVDEHEHKTDDLSLETIGGMVNTVKTLIEIQVKTLEHGGDL